MFVRGQLKFINYNFENSDISNNVFLECPKYDIEPDHHWFQLSPLVQILDIIISLGIVLLYFALIKIMFNTVFDINIKSHQISKMSFSLMNFILEEH